MKIKIIGLKDSTPSYEGYTDLMKVGKRYFRSWDFEQYESGIVEISEKEYKRLLKYKDEKEKIRF